MCMQVGTLRIEVTQSFIAPVVQQIPKSTFKVTVLLLITLTPSQLPISPSRHLQYQFDWDTAHICPLKCSAKIMTPTFQCFCTRDKTLTSVTLPLETMGYVCVDSIHIHSFEIKSDYRVHRWTKPHWSEPFVHFLVNTETNDWGGFTLVYCWFRRDSNTDSVSVHQSKKFELELLQLDVFMEFIEHSAFCKTIPSFNSLRVDPALLDSDKPFDPVWNEGFHWNMIPEEPRFPSI